MSDFKQLHLRSLSGANWEVPNWKQLNSKEEGKWLLEPFSMTKRLKTYCDTFSVEVLGIDQVLVDQLSSDEKILLGQTVCMLREVCLLGDGVPWVCARSLIPLTTMTEKEQDLARLGRTPLGERIFSERDTYRDALNVAEITHDNSILFARRSRLWINQKPLLVSELFLPDAPLYQKRKN